MILDEVQKVPSLLVEVHFVLGEGEVTVAVKGAARVDDRELRSLRVFGQDFKPKKIVVVCNERAPRTVDGIRLLPWMEFLQKLWAGEILA